MDDIDDLQLKAEIDEIMNKVDHIMKKIETLVPQQEQEATHPEN